MSMQFPTATCRIQLREGFDFTEVQQRLDQLVSLGISHLYLSPIFTATPGSTHGYDVTDPTEVDPALGGREGFDRLAAAAAERGLGIILDIVPNHTAFTPQNPWLADVLRHGHASRYARHFDIDWHAGPLVLPFLAEPFRKMLKDGAFRVMGDDWMVGDMAIPLAPGSATTDDLDMLHQAQHWRLVHYEKERDSITHRRFFNVTGLIGMRVEDERVLDDTHALILDLVRSGQVHGLRVDHIDGLADPETYLRRLADRLPDTPVWVEKILVGDEVLPQNWATVGTTGYEAARLIARMLTPSEGIARLDTVWRDATGDRSSFREVLAQSKREVLDHELAAERIQLVQLATAALDGRAEAEAGPETLREAVTRLLVAMPRYRTYVEGGDARPEDRQLISKITDEAAQGLRSDAVLRLLAKIWADPQSRSEQALVTRLQQVTGALLAKSQEDTAGFRWTRYLPANEVGAEPDEPCISAHDATAMLSRGRPSDMILTSSHDTKRSEDARMRMVAISHLPEDFQALWQAAGDLPQAGAVDPRWRWYVAQCALGLFGAPDAAERLGAHLQKAMREAKETSFWTRPDTASEEAAASFAAALLEQWSDKPQALSRLLARGDALILAQLLFKMVMPGFPDIYRATDALFLALTDPDNRRPVDWAALKRLHEDPEIPNESARKAHWTSTLLALRKEQRTFLAEATAEARMDGTGIAIIRRHGDRKLVSRLEMPGTPAGDGARMLDWSAPDGCRVSLTFG
ncbi:malto-oligosyltrehalose synthase [Paracoccus beibuensis]|uniref:malto-oligosyltrehalose synthase n=1 Tax=Paracoccus beibuensis TaxID=547602 RepID=UPI0022406598|nr:malto-oligosyltrehalose synthase [Paracoccus beibuensis]